MLFRCAFGCAIIGKLSGAAVSRRWQLYNYLRAGFKCARQGLSYNRIGHPRASVCRAKFTGSMTENSISHSGTSSYGTASEYSTRKIVGLVLSVLAHALLLWLILSYKSEPKISNPLGEESMITLLLNPEAAASKPKPAKAAPPPAKAAPPKKQPKKVVVRTDAPPLIEPEIVVLAPAPPAPKSEPIQAAPADDMSAMLDAARKRRAEQSRQPSDANDESESQRANRIARANIARAGSQQSRDQSDAGGVFQVRRVGVSSGEFFFRGWNTSSGRTSSQLVNVFSSDGEDIQVAMVQKMIEIIRKEKPDEFVWDSRRLGQEITLSARPEQRARLMEFLLKEFFPNYVASGRK